MILKVEDTDHNFIFEAVGLTQKAQLIIHYDCLKVMKKNEWGKFERGIYKNAGAFVGNTGAHVIICG